MKSRLEWLKLIFLRYYRDMGLRVVLYAFLSLTATMISPFANTFLDEELQQRIDFSSVIPVLTILATSMLAVSTFSLNIMVSAHRAAADATTPRMHRILLENTTTQSVLAAFIGAFVYSLGSIVLYRVGFYPESAAIVVMVITILVVVLVVVSLLRWIQHLTKLGSVEDSLNSARERARDALLTHAKQPQFGANPLTTETVLPAITSELVSPQSGYLQLIDMARLQSCLADSVSVYLDVRPGAHVLEGQVIGHVSGLIEDDEATQLSEAFTFGDQRTHEQDAEFGLVVLSEIASKALSPGVNDPGTAIEALLILKSLLWEFSRVEPDTTASVAPNVFIEIPQQQDLISAAFSPLARDGAGIIEVTLHLRRALAALSKSSDKDMAKAAAEFAQNALMYSREAGLKDRELDQLHAIKFDVSA